MTAESAFLKDLLALTRDGEWGKDSPGDDLVEMSVIRGTDFEAVRYGDMTGVPNRFIPEHIAEYKRLRPADILLETAGGSKNRPTGRSVFLKRRLFDKHQRPITCASFSRFLRVDPSCAVPEYIYWYLQFLYHTGQMRQHQVQHTGVARFQYTRFAGSVAIPLPPRSEQQAIAHILDTLDDRIELNRQMNQTLEAIARAIFKSWFVDFDPVWAKVNGEQPYSMDAETAALFPDTFTDSSLGRIPEGWKAGTVGEDFNITMGQSPPGDTYNEEGDGLPFYQGRLDFGFRYPSLRVYCSAPTRFAKPGDTLVTVRAPVGDINMAIRDCCVGRGVAAVRHKTGSRSYTYYAMQSLRSVFDRFEAEGTVFGSLNKRDFHNLPFLIPPERIVKELEAKVFPIDQLIETNEQQSQTLAELRDTLLPKLISGQLRISDAERFVGEVI